MRKLLALIGVGALAVGLSACGSSGTSGTEVLTGSLTGAPAASILNSSGNPALRLSTLTFSGPVDTSVSNIPLGGGGTGPAFSTPDGNFAVSHKTKKPGPAQPTLTGKTGNTCHFTWLLASGTYIVNGSKSTGKFAGATGHGTYTVSIVASANLLPGKTTCSSNNTGNVLAQGAAINFKASGPLTLKS